MHNLEGSILIVDDTPIIRKTLSFALEKAGHLVTEATDGADALSQLFAQSFDLILLDVEMPRMNGYQVLQKLKTDPHFAHIPVIVISANEDLESAVRCIKLGAVDYLNKPFNPTLLHARVQSCLEKKRLRDNELTQKKELENLYSALKQAHDAKDDFVAMVAHELRNPINGLMAAYEILNRLNAKASNQLPVLTSMYFALDSMKVLVEDLNDISQIESGNISLEFGEVAVPAIIARVVSSLQHKLDLKLHALDVNIIEGVQPIYGDRFRITQILTNLVSNAIKYTPDGGQISISVEPYQHDMNHLHIAVKDSGIGMDPSSINKIFDKYYRVKSDDTVTEEGIGLGMFITKSLVQKHNGHIWIQSEPHKGTAVHFTIPLAPSDEWSIPSKNDTFSPDFALT